MSYLVIRQAIIDRASLTANYENYARHFSPHIIGKHHKSGWEPIRRHKHSNAELPSVQYRTAAGHVASYAASRHRPHEHAND